MNNAQKRRAAKAQRKLAHQAIRGRAPRSTPRTAHEKAEEVKTKLGVYDIVDPAAQPKLSPMIIGQCVRCGKTRRIFRDTRLCLYRKCQINHDAREWAHAAREAR